MIFIADLILAQHVSGTTMPIIRSSRVSYRWLLPVVFGALVFKLSVWCGAEGYVLSSMPLKSSSWLFSLDAGTAIYKFGTNTYPRCIRCKSNLGHIFQGKKCVLWPGNTVYWHLIYDPRIMYVNSSKSEWQLSFGVLRWAQTFLSEVGNKPLYIRGNKKAN
jgi:hypothetical protein